MKVNSGPLPLSEYIATLKRMRDMIAAGRGLSYEDSTEIGNKHTECSWGLCDDTKDLWPDPQFYIWPDQPNRIAPMHRLDAHTCPFRQAKPSANGCFWSCMIFQSGKRNPLPTRDQALALYDAKIAEAESWQKQ
jgi:hypothetical protein